MVHIVAALFDDLHAAQSAVQELVNSDVRRDDISVLTKHGRQDQGPELPGETVSTAGQGAGVGAVVGGLAGLFVGLAALAIPGVGPLLAAGPLAATLAGAGMGAAAGGLAGALMDGGIPHEEAVRFDKGVRAGGTLVTVHTSPETATQIHNVLQRYGAVEQSSPGAEISELAPPATPGSDDAPYSTSPFQIDEHIGPVDRDVPQNDTPLRVSTSPEQYEGSESTEEKWTPLGGGEYSHDPGA